MLSKIDDALLSAHQQVVDLLQREPGEIALMLWRVISVLFLVRCALVLSEGIEDWVDWVTLISAPFSIVIWRLLFAVAAAKMHDFRFFRLVQLLFTVMPFTLTPLGCATQAISMTTLCAIYFCGCDKPKPPRRKVSTRLALN